jgi:hypothetical protein
MMMNGLITEQWMVGSWRLLLLLLLLLCQSGGGGGETLFSLSQAALLQFFDGDD